METIIGLGNAGCEIAEKFKQYPQYTVYKIDVDLEGENCYNLQECNTAVEYEQKCPDLSKFFKKIEGEILFIVGGGGNISGATLRVLHSIKHHPISVLYVKPDEIIGETARLHERATFGILQEYARSGLFKRIFLFSNSALEEMAGDLPVIGYFDKLNDMVVNAVHYLNIAEHIQPIIDNTNPPKEVCRIYTLGSLNTIKYDENLFFELLNIEEKSYYFFINKEKLQTDGKLLKGIKEYVRMQSNESTKGGFAIYSTNYENDFCYVAACTRKIQA
jgi:hypothetical protein